MNEDWKDVLIDDGAYVGLYQVSNLGRVRSNPSAKRKGSKPGRILFQSTDNKGYKQVYLYKKSRQKTVKVARLVATAFLGDRDVLTINHIDGDKTNNSIANLEYVSNKENCRHAHRVIDSRPAIKIDGKKMCVTEAVEKYAASGVHSKMVSRRMHRLGWTAERALKTPPMPLGRPKKGATT